MSAHTPGPWRARPCLDRPDDNDRCDGIAPDYHNHDGDDCFEFDRPGYETCPSRMDIVTTDSGFYGPTWADAVLIAAAPDLLSVCRAIAADASAYPWHIAVRAAIAKAEGR